MVLQCFTWVCKKLCEFPSVQNGLDKVVVTVMSNLYMAWVASHDAVHFVPKMPGKVVCLPSFRTTEAVWMEIMHFLRPSLMMLVEQPSGSWAYKQACMIAAATLLQMWLVYEFMPL